MDNKAIFIILLCLFSYFQFLPAELIPGLFEKLFEGHEEIDKRVARVIAYYKKNWIQSKIHPPESWSQVWPVKSRLHTVTDPGI